MIRLDPFVSQIADAVIHAYCREDVVKALRQAALKAKKPFRISHDAYFSTLFKRLAPYDRRWKLMLRKLWADEMAVILANLKKLKKAQRTKGASDNILYPQGPFKTRLMRETRRLVTAMLADLGQEKLDEIGLGKGLKDMSIAFDVTNPHVKKWIEDYVFRFSEELETVNTQKLRAILDTGFEEGKSIAEMMKEVNGLFDTMNRYRAEVIARTESSRASNQSAIEAYRQSGVVKEKQWLTAPDCCDFCGDMDGKVMGLNEAFFDKGDTFESGEDTMTLDYEDVDGPPLHPNCVLPGTLCETPGGLIVGLRAWYRGQAIEFTFANGRRLSVTQNHLLLTPNGFAPAHLLREGDDVFYCPNAEGEISGDPNNDRKPALVEKIVGTLAKASGMAISRVPLAPEYLHGDGGFCDGHVDIIGPDGLLHGASEAASLKCFGAQPLNRSDPGLLDLSSAGDFASMLKGLADAADGIVGGFRQPHPFFLRRLTHTQEHGATAPTKIEEGIQQTSADDAPRNPEMDGKEFLGVTGQIHLADQAIGNRSTTQEIKTSLLRSGVNSSLLQLTTDAFSMEANLLCDALMGKAGLIQTTKIINIKVFPYSGHVYDLQTMTSLYICNSILSSNCRCSIVAVVD